MNLPHGICLDQYRTHAKELLKAARAADSDALGRIRDCHPEHEKVIASGRIQLADAQLVVARELGAGSWARLKSYTLYRNAVDALDVGDLRALSALLDKTPTLVSARCRTGEWYEQGYFSGAMLLHHVAGNPIRRPIPVNVVDVARLLLDRGADPNAKTDPGGTTIGLILTSKQASEARAALPLIDLLKSAGAADSLNSPDTLTSPLLNVAPETARQLVERGVTMDVRHAAGLGRVEELKRLIAGNQGRDILEEAMAFACVRGEEESVRLLVEAGIRGDTLLRHGGRNPCSALHEAANRGYMSIVRMLLESGADPTVIEPTWNGTPAGWARHDGHTEIAELLEHFAATHGQNNNTGDIPLASSRIQETR